MVEDTLPGSRWVIHAHSFYGGKDKQANFTYAAFVWGAGRGGFANGLQGWKEPFRLTLFMRNLRDSWPITAYRLAPELNISGGKRGVGRIGLDFWPCIRDGRGNLTGHAWGRYPKASWRNLNIISGVIHPGSDGPLGTARFEVMREGLQECEARIFIEMAMESGKLDDAAIRARKTMIAERDAFHVKATGIGPDRAMWTWQSNPPRDAYLSYGENGAWQQYSDKLYRMAAETAAMLGN